MIFQPCSYSVYEVATECKLLNSVGAQQRVAASASLHGKAADVGGGEDEDDSDDKEARGLAGPHWHRFNGPVVTASPDGNMLAAAAEEEPSKAVRRQRQRPPAHGARG